jgi:serine/threonine protein kinase, bacterial
MGEMQVMNLDKVSFHLKEKHNFEWLTNMGEVFSVFDEQDSGNICFGIEQEGTKKFVKYAGAKTKEYTGQPEDAIATLKNSIPIYEDLQHKHLINLLEHFETEKGYVLVFEWFEGECLHSHWTFPPPHKYTHPESPFYRFKQLPIEQRLKSFKSILEFHQNVERNKYVAVDFYDGSILYNFKNTVTKICDIDLYKKKPFINKIGRLWGQELIRKSLKIVLESMSDFKVISLAENGSEAVHLCEKKLPDIILMDIQMPVMDGIQATSQIKERCPESRVIILTTFEDIDHVRDALNSGAEGYIIKAVDPNFR